MMAQMAYMCLEGAAQLGLYASLYFYGQARLELLHLSNNNRQQYRLV